MALLDWFCRCAPGLSIILLLSLVESALQILQAEYLSFVYPTFLVHHVKPGVAQTLFVAYSVFLHILSLAFPLRLCLAVWHATTAIQRAHPQPSNFDSSTPLNPFQTLEEHYNSHANSVVTMAILVPSYKEKIHILEDTLKVLASHKQAQAQYDVFLAMEERDPNAFSTAISLLETFSGRFHDMQFTMHPGGLPGEAPGKSSNIGWAAKEVEKKYHDIIDWKDVLVSVMDSDTHLLSQYFSNIHQSHLRNRQQGDRTDMTLYFPPMVFDRNADQVPTLVHVADLMWCGAGLSCYQSKPTRSGVGIPTAVYTVPLALVRLVHGWDTGSQAIGEDLHMLLKCYFATNGKLAVESIPSPASQCNICTGDARIRGWIRNHRARYTQGLRHMWGALDTGFALIGWLNLGRKTPSSTPYQRHVQRKVSHTNLELKLSQIQLHGKKPSKLTLRNVVLGLRMFEAHFLPSHLFIVMLASVVYSNLSTPIVEFRLLTFFLDVTAVMRIIGFAIMVSYFLVCYERYHSTCVMAREREMKRASLYDEMAGTFAHRRRWNPFTWVDYFIFPVAGTVFGSIPLVHATFAHFWSDQLVYAVSEKPRRAIDV